MQCKEATSAIRSYIKELNDVGKKIKRNAWHASMRFATHGDMEPKTKYSLRSHFLRTTFSQQQNLSHAHHLLLFQVCAHHKQKKWRKLFNGQKLGRVLLVSKPILCCTFTLVALSHLSSEYTRTASISSGMPRLLIKKNLRQIFDFGLAAEMNTHWETQIRTHTVHRPRTHTHARTRHMYMTTVRKLVAMKNELNI